MNVAMFAAFGPLLANVVNGRAAGMVHREFDETWRLPSWKMHVYSHGALTLKVPYVIGFVAADPVGLTSACASNIKALVGIAPRTTLVASWEELTVMGLCDDAVTSGVVAADANLEVLNATPTVLTDDGSASPLKTATSLGVALEAASGNTCDVMMYGMPVTIT